MHLNDVAGDLVDGELFAFFGPPVDVSLKAFQLPYIQEVFFIPVEKRTGEIRYVRRTWTNGTWDIAI